MTPRGYIGAGLGIAVLGGLAFGIASTGGGWGLLLAVVLLTAGGVLTLVGVIGEGVRIGLREAASDPLAEEVIARG